MCLLTTSELYLLIVYLLFCVQQEENQINGLVFLTDLSNLTWSHVKSFNPFVAKRIASIIQVWIALYLYYVYAYV